MIVKESQILFGEIVFMGFKTIYSYHLFIVYKYRDRFSDKCS